MLHSTNPNQPKLTINLFQSEQDDVNEITELLHQAYAPLAKRGLNYVAATQSNSITEERLLSGIAYIVRADGNIVGTLTYYPSVLKDSTEPDFYKVFGTAHFGQFAISPLMQRSGIGSMWVEYIEKKAKLDGMREIACDTAEPAIELIKFYTKRGYREIGYYQWGHAVYRSVILSKVLSIDNLKP